MSGRTPTYLQPALSESLLVTLANIPVRCEEPNHPRGVAQLLVADAVVDELAVAQHVRLCGRDGREREE